MDLKQCGTIRANENGQQFCLSCPKKHLMGDVGFGGGTGEAERLLHEHGAEKLSKTAEGRAVIGRAAKKYERELLQPGHPDFEREYGKEVRERAEARQEDVRKSQEMRRDRGLA